MFDRVQVEVLAGPLKDIQRLVPKPLLRCLGCVLRVVVLLEGEPSPQSEVLSSGAGFHQRSISSQKAKGLNTYVNKVFLFCFHFVIMGDCDVIVGYCEVIMGYCEVIMGYCDVIMGYCDVTMGYFVYIDVFLFFI
jgi:hypothetical protein